MNTRSESIILSPKGTLESCAKFAIDDTATPFIFRKLEIEGEGEYIFSGYIKADAAGTLTIGDQTVNVTTDWQKIEVTLTLSADKLFLYFGTGTNFYLYHPFLVAGKIAHRWVSHPDDFSAVETRLYQTEEGLRSTVKKGSIISEINQTAEEVGIKANKINLNGAVTANNNFKILEDGSIQALNGTFLGDIYLNSGNRAVGTDGSLTMFSFGSSAAANTNFSIGGMDYFGYYWYMTDFNVNTFPKAKSTITYFIPQNFEVYEAYIYMSAFGIQWARGLGVPKNIGAYCTDGSLARANYGTMTNAYMHDEYIDTSDPIKYAFGGQDTWSPAITNNTDLASIQSSNIKRYIKQGVHSIVFQTNNAKPANEDFATAELGTGYFKAYLYVLGYYKI